jgi:glycosyltransferase involved in cell wall biosynthesis
MRNLDPMALVDTLPPRVGGALFTLHAFAWGLYAACAAARRRATLYYTRDASLALWLVLLGCPTVCELHRGASGSARWVLRLVGKRRALRAVIAITEPGRRHIVQAGAPGGKVRVAADGVDLSMFEGLQTRDECRRQLGLPSERRIVGYIGRFRTMEMEKGIPDLVDAVARLSDSLQPPLLLCVGGPMEAVREYRERARHCGIREDDILFVDRVPNVRVPLWIRACDIVTLPLPSTPYFERFPSPMKLFEYLASGVPIVASDLPSLREVLTHGVDAWLVEAGNPEALAAGILRVLEDEHLGRALAAAAGRQALGYGWDHRAARILEAAGIGCPDREGSSR